MSTRGVGEVHSRRRAVDADCVTLPPQGFPAPIERAITVRTGTTFYQDFTWAVGGEPLPLDGFEAVMSIARRHEEEPLAVARSVDGEIFIQPDGVLGLIRVAMPDTKTAAIDWPQRLRLGHPALGVYDLVVVNDSVTPRQVLRVAHGTVALERGVTQLP